MKSTILVLTSLFLLLVACATPIATLPPTPTPGSPFALAGTKWVLENLTLDGVTQTPIEPHTPTLEFSADGQIGGTGGCNGFGGRYTAQGEILLIQEIRRTLMACGPAEIMPLEDAYFAALVGARLFEKTADQLTITFAKGKGRLVFRVGQ